MRDNLNKIDECKGNICNKSYLVAVLYQPDSVEKEKLIWIEKLDPVLSIINCIYRTIIITDDTNIDYLKPSVALNLHFSNIIKYLRKSCFRANYQLYLKETIISPLSINLAVTRIIQLQYCLPN